MELQKRIKSYIRISKTANIARRYFILNGFDGLYTMLGIIIGAYVAGHQEPGIVLGAGLSGIMALGLSGSASAYISERTEQERELERLERHMLTELDSTLQGKARVFGSLFTAMVNGFAPIITSLIMVSPFFLAAWGWIGIENAFVGSILLGVLEIFGFGCLLGQRMKNSVKLQYGMYMLGAASITAVVSYFIGRTFT